MNEEEVKQQRDKRAVDIITHITNNPVKRNGSNPMKVVLYFVSAKKDIISKPSFL